MKRLQCSLRAVLFSVTCLALVLGWCVNAARTQARIASEFTSRGCDVQYESDYDPEHEKIDASVMQWLIEATRRVVGRDFVDSVALVRVREGDITDADCRLLARLKGLRFLGLAKSSITDAGLSQLASLQNLEQLFVNETRATPSGLLAFQRTRSLYHLDVDNLSGAYDEWQQVKAALSHVEYFDGIVITERVPIWADDLSLALPRQDAQAMDDSEVALAISRILNPDAVIDEHEVVLQLFRQDSQRWVSFADSVMADPSCSFVVFSRVLNGLAWSENKAAIPLIIRGIRTTERRRSDSCLEILCSITGIDLTRGDETNDEMSERWERFWKSEGHRIRIDNGTFAPRIRPSSASAGARR